MKRIALGIAKTILLAIVLPVPTLAAEMRTIDWTSIPAQSITVFYPGESTYDWLISRAHKGARSVKQGKACVSCH